MELKLRLKATKTNQVQFALLGLYSQHTHTETFWAQSTTTIFGKEGSKVLFVRYDKK